VDRDTFASGAEVLRAFRPVMRAIAAAAGPSCEVVLHNLDGSDIDLGHTIMAIENGHVTGRSVGGPSTSLGLEVVRDRRGDHDAFGYRGFTSEGKELRCSSVYFHNDAGDIIAALCVNVDLSGVQQARGILDALLATSSGGTPPSSPTPPDEIIGSDLVSVMDAMITQAISEAGKPVDRMTRDDRIAVLQRLDRQGVTRMRKSVEQIAARLGISRVTAYAYLDEARTR
jgi:predicted transcriptional regulator YheO